MKLLAFGLTAALALGAASFATPASAEVVFEYRSAPARYYRPPPPKVYYYRPAPAYYRPAPPRRVCKVTTVREWGPYGRETRRVETCRNRW